MIAHDKRRDESLHTIFIYLSHGILVRVQVDSVIKKSAYHSSITTDLGHLLLKSFGTSGSNCTPSL